MTYWNVFFKLFFFSFLGAILAIIPATITTGFIFGYYPSLLFLISAPTVGFLFTTPAIFITAAFFKQLIKRNILSVIAYTVIAAVVITVITGVIYVSILPAQKTDVFVQLLYSGGIAGAIFGWRLKKSLKLVD